MVRTPFAAAVGAALIATMPVDAQHSGEVHRSAYHDYRIVTVADGFESPWSIAFLPGGDMLVTQRPGRLRIIRDADNGALSLPGGGGCARPR